MYETSLSWAVTCCNNGICDLHVKRVCIILHTVNTDMLNYWEFVLFISWTLNKSHLQFTHLSYCDQLCAMSFPIRHATKEKPILPPVVDNFTGDSPPNSIQNVSCTEITDFNSWYPDTYLACISSDTIWHNCCVNVTSSKARNVK